MSRTILLLTNRVPYPLHDGGALAMDAMIRGYAAAGWQVHLLAMNTSRHQVTPEKLKTLFTDIAGFHTVLVPNEVNSGQVLKNFLFSRDPEHADRFRSAAFADKLRSLLGEVKPDVAQLESPFLASYIPVIREAANSRVVYRVHNIEGDIWARLATQTSGLKRFYLRSLAHRMARYEDALWHSADLLLLITQKDADRIAVQGVKTPIVVAPFGIRVKGSEVSFPAGPFKVYHIGAMDWLPNLEGVSWFLKEVWPLVHESNPETEFHFAGRAMPEIFLKTLPPGAFCHGEVGDAQAFIADKHALIVPIQSGSGIRVKTLEAMAAGKLVISTDVGMQGIEAQPDLHYLRANSAQEFAHLIAWAASHPEKAEATVRAAHRLVREHYDQASIMKRVIAALDTKRSG